MLFRSAFGRHVHWGYWPDPQLADGTPEDFALAAEDLCQRLCDLGEVGDGLSILDAGCGFGGTLASLNERFSGLDLIGLNLDGRQLARAAERIHPIANNRLAWLEADACSIPLDRASRDVVMAVECIFHFPSRERFFQECARVLLPGGRLVLSDFVPTPALLAWQRWGASGGSSIPSAMAATYGTIDTSFGVRDYQRLARRHGLELQRDQDITRQTLPTYPVVEGLFASIDDWDAVRATRTIAWLSRLGLLRYRLMVFRVSAGNGEIKI